MSDTMTRTRQELVDELFSLVHPYTVAKQQIDNLRSVTSIRSSYRVAAGSLLDEYLKDINREIAEIQEALQYRFTEMAYLEACILHRDISYRVDELLVELDSAELARWSKEEGNQ